MMRWMVLLILCVAAGEINAQNYPQGYFRSPLDTPLFLAANFGAVRANHFHSGIDIKTYGKEGLPVVAAADGYVARIKVSPVGYGKALYINHPNGYTTVYGHLQSYSPAIDSVVRAEQYRQKSFEVELFLTAGKIKINSGELIGISGNSGGSTGPHLHFEIRDTHTEEIINPLLFGLPIEDIYNPRLSPNFLVYERNEEFKHTNGYYPYVQVTAKNLKIHHDTIKVRPGQYSFAVWGEDYINESGDGVHLNYLGLYEDDRQVYGCSINRFAFDETRMVNTHIDYNCYCSNSEKWHKCYVDEGNKLGFYSTPKKLFVNALEGVAKYISIKTNDLAGHADSISFFLVGDTAQSPFMMFHPKNNVTEFATPNKTYTYKNNSYSFTIPYGALYDTIAVTTKQTSVKRKNLYAGFISIMNRDIPVQKSFTVSIKPGNIKGLDVSKLVIVRLSGKGYKNMSCEGGEYSNGFVTATSKTFGIFSVAYDNTKPVVDGFRVKHNTVTARISDALSGINTYNAYIDDEWLLMEYDAKNDKLEGILPNGLATGKHEFKLVVTDNRNNKNTFVQTIETP